MSIILNALLILINDYMLNHNIAVFIFRVSTLAQKELKYDFIVTTKICTCTVHFFHLHPIPLIPQHIEFQLDVIFPSILLSAYSQ